MKSTYLNLTPEAREVLNAISRNSCSQPALTLERILELPDAQLPWSVGCHKMRDGGRNALFLNKDIKCEFKLSLYGRRLLKRQAKASYISKSDYVELLLTLLPSSTTLERK